MAELPPGFTLIDEPAGEPLVVTVAPNRQQRDIPPLPEGFTLIADEKPGMLETAARSAVQGLTFGLADESYGLTQGVRGLLSGEGFGAGYDRGVKEFRDRDKAGREANPVTGVLGEVAGGMGTGLGAMRAGATLMRGGMSLPKTMVAGAAEGAGYGALHGAGNAEGGPEERLSGAQRGLMTGAAVGGAVPLVAKGIGAATRAITPLSIPAENQAAAAILRQEGVPVTAGQISGSKAVKYAESALGDAPFAGGRTTEILASQGDDFTRAAMRRAGGTGTATAENMATLYDDLGATFKGLSARNTLTADPQLGQDIGIALRNYERILKPDQKAIVGNYAVDIVQRLRATGGRLPGDEYQTIRSRLTKSAHANRNDGEFSDALKGIRNALDNAMERSILPADKGAWAKAQREYRNYKVLEDAVGRAGSDAAAGRISPQALRGAAMKSGGKSGYVRGKGDFADLARSGELLMTPMPNSGTAQRGLSIGGASGATAAFMSGNYPLALAAIAAPGVAGRTLMSPMVQRYMTNQRMGPVTQKAIEQHLRGLLQGGGQTQSRRLSSPR